MNNMSKKIVIVDNELHIRMLMTQALRKLEKAGVRIFTAENGDQALEIIDREQPDLIFLDLMMPGLHGFDVCRLIKSYYLTREAHIVIVSARSQMIDKQMGSISGADGYIVKPFDPEMIARRAQEILKLTPVVAETGGIDNSRNSVGISL